MQVASSRNMKKYQFYQRAGWKKRIYIERARLSKRSPAEEYCRTTYMHMSAYKRNKSSRRTCMSKRLIALLDPDHFLNCIAAVLEYKHDVSVRDRMGLPN